MKASGAGVKALNDIEATCEGLDVFAEMDFADFAALLAHFREAGALPTMKIPKARGGGSARTPKAAAISVGGASEIVRGLMDRVRGGDVTFTEIDLALKPLDKLKKDDILALVEEFGLSKPKTNKAGLAAIRAMIQELEKSRQQTFSIH